jgi:hypothetical protein
MITNDLTNLYFPFPILIASGRRLPQRGADRRPAYGGLNVLPNAADAAPGLQARPVG